MSSSEHQTHDPWLRTANPAPSILDHIGQTPTLELPRLAAWAGVSHARLFLKLESLNPGGSTKDRLALALLDGARAQGLQPGGIVVEATSGNTGIALAQACAVQGYELHIVASEKVSEEKVRIVQAFGATVHRVPLVPHGHPQHYMEVAPRLAKQLGGIYLDQFGCAGNTAAHAAHTAPELLDSVRSQAGRLDVLIAGVGTGGTISGCRRHLGEASPTTELILADPEGSILAGGAKPSAYKVEGIGDDAIPPLYDIKPDGAQTIPDREAFEVALAAARTEGILIGGSAGAHLAAAIRIARERPAGTVLATIAPDTGRNYLSTFFDPTWCDANGFTGLHEVTA